MSKVTIGLDFGTTNTVVAYFPERGNVFTALGGENGESSCTPSLAYYSGDSEDWNNGDNSNEVDWSFGTAAANVIPLNRVNGITFSEVKMYLTKHEMERGGLKVPPEKIVSKIIKHVIENAEGILKNKFDIDGIDSVILTVPCNFENETRNKLIGAVKAAGYNVVKIIEEPVAAAIYLFSKYSRTDLTVPITLNANEIAVVFDLGGGTLDLVAIKRENNEFGYGVIKRDGKDVCMCHMDDKGGNLWDECISKKIKSIWINTLTDVYRQIPKVDAETYINKFLIAEKNQLERFHYYCVQLKERLSSIEHGALVDFADFDLVKRERPDLAVENKRIRIKLFRAEFEDASRDIRSEIFTFLSEFISDIRKNNPTYNIKYIITIGGGSWLPQIKNGLEEEFNDILIIRPDPGMLQACVAAGAALYAKELAAKTKATERGNTGEQNKQEVITILKHLNETDEPQKTVTASTNQSYAEEQYKLGEKYYDGDGVEQNYQKAVEWWTKAAEQGYADAQFRLGVCYKNGTGVEKDERKAVEWWTKAAEQGYAKAQFNLGWCYQHETGVEMDERKAVYWYTKAAEQGVDRAQFRLGVCYENGIGVEKDERKAVEWYKKAAEQGHANAQFNLGWCYDKGIGVEIDERKAVEWYKKAAEQGHADAQFNLGVCYEYGVGVEKDERKAVEWWTKAAGQGEVRAQYNLGVCYLYGIGVEKDERKAVVWYTKAAEQGDADAQFRLGVCYENGTGVEKDERKAVEWYTKAAEQGHAEAQNNLGECYYYGTGVKKDERKAVEWYTKAAEQGHANAQYNLGVCYDNGIGVEKDERKAVEWYTKAAEQGHAEAQCCLGWCYQYGTGVEKDERKAVEWYTKAAEQGHADAQCNLGWCYDKGIGVEKDERKAEYWYTKAAEQGHARAQMIISGEGIFDLQAQMIISGEGIFDAKGTYLIRNGGRAVFKDNSTGDHDKIEWQYIPNTSERRVEKREGGPHVFIFNNNTDHDVEALIKLIISNSSGERSERTQKIIIGPVIPQQNGRRGEQAKSVQKPAYEKKKINQVEKPKTNQLRAQISISGDGKFDKYGTYIIKNGGKAEFKNNSTGDHDKIEWQYIPNTSESRVEKREGGPHVFIFNNNTNRVVEASVKLIISKSSGERSETTQMIIIGPRMPQQNGRTVEQAKSVQKPLSEKIEINQVEEPKKKPLARVSVSGEGEFIYNQNKHIYRIQNGGSARFENKSVNYTKIEWKFKPDTKRDEVLSIEDSESQVFTFENKKREEINASVKLIVSNSYGEKSTKKIDIVIEPGKPLHKKNGLPKFLIFGKRDNF